MERRIAAAADPPPLLLGLRSAFARLASDEAAASNALAALPGVAAPAGSVRNPRDPPEPDWRERRLEACRAVLATNSPLPALLARGADSPFSSHETFLSELRTGREDPVLRADVIAGFPGETDADFEETVRLVRDYPFSNLHIFPYSERPGTPAAAMPGAVPVRVRRERARALIAIGEEKRAAFAASLAGAEADVLVERVGPDGTASGWTGQYLRARIPDRTPADAGALLRVRVLRAEGDLLLVRPI